MHAAPSPSGVTRQVHPLSRNPSRMLRGLDRFLLPCVIVALTLVLATMNDRFFTLVNIMNLLRQMSFNMILSLGMTFVIISGGVDLSVGSIMALSSMITGITMLRFGVVAGIAGGLLTGMVIGLANGVLITFGGLAPFIATAGMMSVVRGAALLVTKGEFVTGFPLSFEFIGRGYVGRVPVPVLIAAGLVLVCHYLFVRTPYGMELCAIGGNPSAARLSGIPVRRVLIATYAVCGLLAGITGMVLTARVTSGQPGFGMDDSLMAVAAVIIGGTAKEGGEGGIDKTVLGVVLIGLVMNGLNLMGVDYFWQQVGIGTIIVLAVTLSRLRRSR